jgi:transcriptional regulator with XRE-family HTH domain
MKISTESERRLTMNIRELRQEAKITQAELAARVGVSAQRMCQYEKGQRSIPVSLLIPIKDALGCTWEELFDGKTETD